MKISWKSVGSAMMGIATGFLMVKLGFPYESWVVIVVGYGVGAVLSSVAES